jgi:hypothetical protein
VSSNEKDIHIVVHKNPSKHKENLKEAWLMDQKMKRYKTHTREKQRK